MAFALGLASLCTPNAHAQNIFDDFSSGNDSAWLRVDGPEIVFGTPSSYSVSGGTYRIGTPANSLGISAYSFRADAVAIDSQISVDIVDWDPNVGTAASITARASVNAAGNLQYYTLSFLSESMTFPGQSNLALYRANAGGPLDLLTGNSPFPKVAPGRSVRLVMTLLGAEITGEIFDLQTGASLSYQRFVDTSPMAILGPGAPGLDVATFTPTATEPTYATFDNFRVVPSPGAAAVFGLGALFAARRRR